MKNRKTALILVIAFVVLIFSGCTEAPSATVAPEEIFTNWSRIPYDDYSNGITSYYANLSYHTRNIELFFDDENYYKKLNDTQKEYFREAKLLLSVFATELSSLPEYDFLSGNDSEPDRTEGELLVSGMYGYKLKNNTQIRFGCDNKTAGGSYIYDGLILPDKNYLEINVEDVFSDNTKCSTVIESVITDEKNCVIRYSKSTEKDGEVITKIAFIVIKNNSAEIAYYEGSDLPSQLVKLDSLINYNINAITFGIGTVISFVYQIK